MKEWFAGRSVDERQEEPGLPWWLWALLILGVAALLASCATAIEGVCAVQPIGEDENGVAFFRYRCEPAK